MEFLGIGPLELLVVVLIAIVVIGPRDIGNTARSIGRMLNRMYKSEAWKTLLAASTEVRNLPNRLAREAELEELEKLANPEAAPASGPATSSSGEAAQGTPAPQSPAEVVSSPNSEPPNSALPGPADGSSSGDSPLSAWVRPRQASEAGASQATDSPPKRPTPNA